MTKKSFFILSIFLFLGVAFFCSAHLPRIVYTQSGDVKVRDPQNSQAFFDELKGQSRNYLVSSEKEFTLYINLLVPAVNGNARYSANIYSVKDSKDEKIAAVDGTNFTWTEYFEEFDRDYYEKGPEWEQKLTAGDYKIEVFGNENSGKYVIAIGKNEVFPIIEALKSYLILPQLKAKFFQTSPLEFIFTKLGQVGIGIIGAILFVLAFFNYIISVINKILGRKPQMMLLTSSGMQGSREDIMAILPKPADDVRLAYIITASKPETNQDYVEQDERLMREAGFNVERVDIEGKNQAQLLYLLRGFDIIYVQGGNTYYLLKCMRACGFRKIMKKLFREGIIYIGASAGSIVMGKSIKTTDKFGTGTRDHFGVSNLDGLGFVPFSILPHFNQERADIIKSKIPNPKKRKDIKIIADGQAIFVIGKKTTFVGTGEVVNPQNL